MLDHNDRIACVSELHQYLQQFFNIGKVQPCCRLIENVNGAACRPFRKLGRKFHPLRFPTRKSRARLAEPQIA